MAQFDVHRNTGKQRDAIPYVVVVQSSLYDRYRRRVVIPLVLRGKLESFAASVYLPLNPVFKIEGVDVVLHPLEIVSVATPQLGKKAGTLAKDGGRIISAADELLTRPWA